MASIPQITIYMSQSGEISAETGANGGRIKIELPDDTTLWGDILHQKLIERRLDLADSQAMEKSLKHQRKARIQGITDAEVVEDLPNQSAIFSETYKKFKIKVYRIPSGGVVAKINGKLIKTHGLEIIARFTETAYAIRAARVCIDTNPDSWPELPKATLRVGEKRAPRLPATDVEVQDLDI